MVFDKTKAMRNAERHLAQGKIQSAIGEYKQVVANDPKDFGTLNMLGDLYAKNSDKKQAVVCYTSVGEYYSKQGFAQKAIAIYNKIAKLQPGMIEITAKLAELYRLKGSVNEARAHYKIVAEHYESQGQKIEALEIRKEIAALDPNDTTIQFSLADAYLQENQFEQAAEAFVEAGIRLAKKSSHADAIEAFDKALAHVPVHQKALAGLTQSHFALGTADLAAERLAQIHLAEPHDREVLVLLIDCQNECGNTAEAEKAILALVEREPANYPKLVELARIYLKNSDVDSAGRIMAMASEHLLMAGQADEFQSLVTEILALDPDHLEGLRQCSRLAAWQRDERGMHDSLAQLARAARDRESVEDERYALSQLVMIAPHEMVYVERLLEINHENGYEEAYAPDDLFDKQFSKSPKQPEPELETFAPEPSITHEADVIEDVQEIAEVAVVADDEETGAGDHEDQERLLREADSIRFYIDSGYIELAEKAIGELTAEFGNGPEVEQLTSYLAAKNASGSEESVETPETIEVAISVEPEALLTNGHSLGFGIDDLRTELGIEEPDASVDSDYDTHYHTAVAYQEMGLLDEAVKEFQEAVSLVQPSDPTRRFFHCANLLGHCFMQKSMPNLALTWFQRALETPGLGDEEKQGIWYEIALAHEAEGDLANAGRYFEQVYAENIDFRDVSQRVKNIAVTR
ncbi:MAG: hypothetical protein DMF63_02210 [Acidobacteria bacterium]|nr:MAG: hypothetical protein DMF63_02210 [Acidobacteriota bacterium]